MIFVAHENIGIDDPPLPDHELTQELCIPVIQVSPAKVTSLVRGAAACEERGFLDWYFLHN